MNLWHRILSLPSLFLMFLLLAACSNAPLQVMAPSSKALHTVADRENVYAISRRYFVSTRDIIRANDLRPPYRLHVGQRLHIPRLRVHTIVKGDTLGGIVETYQVSLYALARLNRLKPPYRIIQGKKLQIPSSQYRKTLVPKVAEKSAPEAKLTLKPQSQPTLQDLKIVKALQHTSTTWVAERSKTPAKMLVKKAKKTSSKPTIQSSGQMIWPLRGKVVSRFGSKSQGMRNDGINISAKVGSAVKAVDHGMVVYSGDKLSGFGWILVIRHDNGLMSAYAHNEALLVKRGDQVRQGQVIARSGKSGNVTSGQLHFEIRQGSRPVDPLRHLQG